MPAEVIAQSLSAAAGKSPAAQAMRKAYIGLGSNLANPVHQIQSALGEIAAIPGIALGNVSSLYQTAPVGLIDQPAFINAVAELSTLLLPRDLLRQLAAIEQGHHRQRTVVNGPRTLDLDILLFDELAVNESDLVIPHPRMHQRAFVLIPLHEIAPQIEIPGLGAARDWLMQMDASQVAKIGSFPAIDRDKK